MSTDNCCTIVCLNVPSAGFEFGIDYESFFTGERFKDEQKIRQGCFVHLKEAKQIVVREWDPLQEWLHKAGKQTHINNLKAAVENFEFDGCLGTYPQEHLKTWQKLSKYITLSVLQRCNIYPLDLLVPGSLNSEKDISIAARSEGDLDQDIADTVHFTVLKRMLTSASPDAKTRFHFDCSDRLEELLATVYEGKWEDLLGEIQVAFILFLHLSSLGALTQWKNMMWLICSCETTPFKYPYLYEAFMRLVAGHLKQIPVDFFEDELADENFIVASLASLFEILEGSNSQLIECVNGLKNLLKNRFHVDLEILDCYAFADSSCAPVLVTPDELPATVWTHNSYDTDEFNKQIADEFLNASLKSVAKGCGSRGQ